METKPQPVFLDVAEAAAYFGRTKAAVYSWIKNEWIRSVSVKNSRGRCAAVRVRRSDAEKMKRIIDLGLPPSASRLKGVEKLTD